MRRFARYTLNILTVLSLLLCVATAGLWVRSYRFEDHAGVHHLLFTKEGRPFDYRSGLFSARGVITWSGRGDNPGNSNMAATTLWKTNAGVGIYWARPGAFEWWYHERDESFILGFGSNDSIRADPHAFVAGSF